MFDWLPDFLNSVAWYAAWLIYIRCYCCGVTNDACVDGCDTGTATEEYQIDVAGVVNGTNGSQCLEDDCPSLDTTTILTYDAFNTFPEPTSCVWDYGGPTVCGASLVGPLHLNIGCLSGICPDNYVEVQVNNATGTVWMRTAFTVPGNCTTGINGLVLTYASGPDSFCDFTSATITVTSMP